MSANLNRDRRIQSTNEIPEPNEFLLRMIMMPCKTVIVRSYWAGMYSPSAINVLRPLVLACAMLVFWAFSPERALAGCGDYNSPGHSPEMAEFMKSQGKSPVKTHCQGPNCSRQPLAPAPLREAPVRGVSAENDLTSVLFETPSFVVASRPLPADQNDWSPAGLAMVIYHPPR